MRATSELTLLAFCKQAQKDPVSCGPSGSPGVSNSRGSIAQLQEYVQEASTAFALPASCSVLQWDISTRASSANLEFRATVAFLLEGVPHHVAGVWKPSKKAAQRDAAERALELYAPRVEAGATREEEESRSPLAAAVALRDEQPWFVATTPEAAQVPMPQRLLPQGAPRALLCAPPGLSAPPGQVLGAPPGLELLEDTQSEVTQQEHVDLLRDFCDEMGWPSPRFSFKTEGDGCLAMVEIVVLGVLHTFSGQLCEDFESAEANVAKRVLWYLRAPGSEDAFEPDEEYARKAAQLIPGPPKADWVKDGVLQDKVAERKTTVMVVQNRLQQVFSQQTAHGTPVWHWSYERGRRAGLDPRLYRAKVTIPLAGRQFVGKWMYDKRAAQIDACSHVMEFIDKEYPPKR